MVRSQIKIVIPLIIIVSLWTCSARKESSGIVFILPEGSDSVMLFDADSVKSDNRYLFRSLGDDEPYIVLDSLLIELGDSASNMVPLPFGRTFDDIHWKNGNCFFASDSVLYFGDKDGMEYPIVIADSDIRVFDLDDDGILFVKDSLLSFYSFKQRTVDVLYVSDCFINDVEILADSYLFSTGTDLFILDKKSLYCIFSAETEILSFVMHPNGSVFYSTVDGVLYLDPDYNSVQIVNKPAADLTLIGDSLFITFIDKSSCMISNASSFYSSFINNPASVNSTGI